MTTGDKLRLKLFDIFSKNLSINNPSYINKFMCPLCMELFTRKDASNPDKLSVAHIWSKHLASGIPHNRTLTCTKCNNEMGQQLEGEEKKRIDSHNGAIIKEVYLSVPDLKGYSTATMKISNDQEQRLRLQISQDAARSNPTYLNQITQKITEGLPFTIRFKAPFDPIRANLSYLHSSYLRLFHTFGYNFVFMRLAAQIRKAFLQPRLMTFPLYMINLTGRERESLKSDSDTLFAIIRPLSMYGFLVVSPIISIGDSGLKRIGVIIPILTAAFEGKYTLPPNTKIDCEPLLLKPLEYLTIEESKNMVVNTFNLHVKEKTGIEVSTTPFAD